MLIIVHFFLLFICYVVVYFFSLLCQMSIYFVNLNWKICNRNQSHKKLLWLIIIILTQAKTNGIFYTFKQANKQKRNSEKNYFWAFKYYMKKISEMAPKYVNLSNIYPTNLNSHNFFFIYYRFDNFVILFKLYLHKTKTKNDSKHG